MARQPATWATSSGHRSGQENTEEEPGHDPGHDTPTSVGRGQVGGEGDHDLAGNRRGAHGDGGQAEDPDVRGKGARHQGHRGHAEDADHQDAPRVEVAQRYNE